jgi:hypothetical protein
MPRDVQRRLRQQRAVGGDRAAVRADLAQSGLEVRIRRPGRTENLDASLGGSIGDRTVAELQAAA